MSDDGRVIYCPLCGNRTTYGTLKAHIGSIRCMAQVAEADIVLDSEQKKLRDFARAYDRAIFDALDSDGARSSRRAQVLRKTKDPGA
jgi:hypothetical protein